MPPVILACPASPVTILKADRILYFIDARQSLHMKQVFITGRKANFAPAQRQS